MSAADKKDLRNRELQKKYPCNQDLEIVDGYMGTGYALSRPDEPKLITPVCRREGCVLDPVHIGKAFFSLAKQLRIDPQLFGERIVFMHTGGLFGLFPRADELQPIL